MATQPVEAGPQAPQREVASAEETIYICENGHRSTYMVRLENMRLDPDTITGRRQIFGACPDLSCLATFDYLYDEATGKFVRKIAVEIVKAVEIWQSPKDNSSSVRQATPPVEARSQPEAQPAPQSIPVPFIPQDGDKLAEAVAKLPDSEKVKFQKKLTAELTAS